MGSAVREVEVLDKLSWNFSSLIVESINLKQFNVAFLHFLCGKLTPGLQPHLLFIGGGAVWQELNIAKEVFGNLCHSLFIEELLEKLVSPNCLDRNRCGSWCC